MSELLAPGLPKRRLAPLWALILVFALPSLAAWFLVLYPQYLPAGRLNRGELLEPQIPLGAEAGLLDRAGDPFDFRPLNGHWTLLSVETDPCESACRERLTALRQIRLALGEGQYSLERLVILIPAVGTAELEQEFPGLRIALAPGTAGTRLRATLGDSVGGGRYIRDPAGQLMLRYPPGAPARDTLHDLERLLKASKNWIKGTAHGHR